MLKVKIDRKKWARSGNNSRCLNGCNGYSNVLRANGTQCCIGFLCKAAGLKNRDIDNISDIRGLNLCNERIFYKIENFLKRDKTHGYTEKSWIDTAYNINDSKLSDDTEKEFQLIKLGLKNGVQFEFYN